jgi:hypothetical protein
MSFGVFNVMCRESEKIVRNFSHLNHAQISTPIHYIPCHITIVFFQTKHPQSKYPLFNILSLITSSLTVRSLRLGSVQVLWAQ